MEKLQLREETVKVERVYDCTHVLKAVGLGVYRPTVSIHYENGKYKGHDFQQNDQCASWSPNQREQLVLSPQILELITNYEGAYNSLPTLPAPATQ